jgi:hypothetical protein
MRSDVTHALVAAWLAFLLVFCSVATAQDSSETTKLQTPAVIAKDAWRFNTKEFRYCLGGWPMLVPQEIDTSFRRMDEELNRRFHPFVGTQDSLNLIRFRLCTCFRSPYFRSEFHLYYVTSPLLTMGGGFPPRTIFFARKDSASEYVALDSFDLRLDMPYPDLSTERPLRYLLADRTIDSIGPDQMIPLAIDVVSLVSPCRPIIFVDSIDDVRHFSNVTKSRAIWNRLERDAFSRDTLLILLSRFRVMNVSENSYLALDSCDFLCKYARLDSLREVVHPPKVRENPDGKQTVVLYTWSLSCGSNLYEWEVTFDRDGYFQVRQRRIGRDVGDWFGYM